MVAWIDYQNLDPLFCCADIADHAIPPSVFIPEEAEVEIH